jgi:hypothetical protein
MPRRRCLRSIFFCTCALAAFALAALPAGAQKRAALVVGNSAYSHASPLANPTNDAEDRRESLGCGNAQRPVR